MSINWKEAARHYRYYMMLADQQEGRLKRRLYDAQRARIAFATKMADILIDIAYDDDDPNQEYCKVCSRRLIEEHGHQPGCLYVTGLAIVAEASRHGDL